MMVSASNSRTLRTIGTSRHALALSCGDGTNPSPVDVDCDIVATILKRFSSPLKLISITDICERIGRSRAWAYENIVGNEAKKAKASPPFPWDWLPPRVPNTKSQWLESEFEHWFQCVVARARAGEGQGDAA